MLSDKIDAEILSLFLQHLLKGTLRDFRAHPYRKNIWKQPTSHCCIPKCGYFILAEAPPGIDGNVASCFTNDMPFHAGFHTKKSKQKLHQKCLMMNMKPLNAFALKP